MNNESTIGRAPRAGKGRFFRIAAHRSSFLYDLSLKTFTEYNSSFKHHHSEDHSLPQSRRRKVRHRSHPGKKHGANRRSDKTVKIVAFLIIAALIVAGVIYLLNRSGNPTPST